MEFGIVGRITEGLFRYQGWPTVAKDQKGVLYVASSGHRLAHVCPFGKDLLYISHDDGASWLGPIIANDSAMDDRDAGLVAWGNGQLLLSWFAHPREFYKERETRNPSVLHPLSLAARQEWASLDDADHAYGAYIKLSQDGGKTWSQKIRVPVSAPHGPIRRADGSFLYLGRGFYSPDPGYLQGRLYAAESLDGGHHWQRLGEVPLPPDIAPERICEPHAVELPDGTLLCAFRVNRLDAGTDNTIFTTFSQDDGRTWSIPQPTGFQGAPPHLLLHSSGALVMSYSRRTAPFGQRARISHDGGRTWGEELVISQEAPDWDLGYPSTVELSDGSLFTTYYQKFPGDSYPSVLSTHWNLP